MRIEVAGASSEEVAAIVAALSSLDAREKSEPVPVAPSRWKAAVRGIDDGYERLHSLVRARALRRPPALGARR